MKNKKVFSLILALVMLFTVFGPMASLAANPVTDVTIHKVEIKDPTNYVLTDNDGHLLTTTEFQTRFGSTAVQIPNVTFKYWSVTETEANTMKATPASYDTEAEVVAYTGEATGTVVTGATGEVTINALPEGYYWFIEVPPTTITGTLAVPFLLTLPATNAAGTSYLTAVHCYPKNTVAPGPMIDKDVTFVGNDHSTFNIGDTQTWIITPTVPVGIGDYTSYVVSDTIDSKLDYADNLVVTYNAQTLVLTTDYTVSAPTVGDSGLLTVTFTAAGLDKLALYYSDPTTYGTNTASSLQIKFDTKINETATMGDPISNSASLAYNNGGSMSGTATVPAGNQPEVHCGGEQFLKISDQTSPTVLAGAVFKIATDAAGTTFIDSNALLLAANTNASKEAETNDLLLTSGASGVFVIKGLAYGTQAASPSTNGTAYDTGSTTYYLVEITPPTGYALPTNPITSFTVDHNSFSNAAYVTIKNKKITIPQTGGIGTAIFTIAGLALMGTSVVAFKKRNEE